jgi:hypothetical protein
MTPDDAISPQPALIRRECIACERTFLTRKASGIAIGRRSLVARGSHGSAKRSPCQANGHAGREAMSDLPRR